MRIDPRTNHVAGRTDVSGYPQAVAVTASVRMGDFRQGVLWRYDPTTEALQRVTSNGEPRDIAAAGDQVYVAVDGNAFSGLVARYDAATGERKDSLDLLACAVASGESVVSIGAGPPGFGPVHWHGGMMGSHSIRRRPKTAPTAWSGTWPSSSKPPTRNRTSSARWSKPRSRTSLPMREKVQSARLKARELLTQPTVDRAEIERFRTEQIALADAFSKRVSQAIGDAAEILTPDQRRKLNDRLPPPGGPGRHWNW